MVFYTRLYLRRGAINNGVESGMGERTSFICLVPSKRESAGEHWARDHTHARRASIVKMGFSHSSLAGHLFVFFTFFFNFIFVVRVCSSVFILHPSCPRSNRTRQVNHNKRWHRRGPSLAIFRSAFRQSLDAEWMMDSTAVPTTTLYSLQFSYSFVYETRRFAGLGELMRLTYWSGGGRGERER